MEFGLIFFSSMGAGFDGDKYRLPIESARFADASGLSSVWIPERHFTKDGWLYPNPAVLHAALARLTTRIALRAGSVVMPLHDPIRVAEEWAVVDNLSAGRVGISFASGWHPDDFVFFPERYASRHEEMYRGIETVQKLWRGEAIEITGGNGQPVKVRTYPRPLQPELPIWITAAGDPRTFEAAGKLGVGVLTHMFNQSLEELAHKIQIYRDSLARHGHDPASGQVSLMLHTFVAADFNSVHDEIQKNFCEYLKSASYLLNAIAFHRGQHIDLATLSPKDVDDYVGFVFERLLSEKRVLFGTPETCVETVAGLRAIGVSEIACQMDFGVDTDLVLRSLPDLVSLKEFSSAAARQSGQTPSHRGDQISEPQPDARLEDIRARCTQEMAGQEFYDRLRDRGIQFGATFQGVQRLWRRDGESLGFIQLPTTLESDSSRYGIHPALLDACFQVLIAALPNGTAGHEGKPLYLPVGLGRFQVHNRPGSQIWSHARLRNGGEPQDSFEGDVQVFDDDGKVLLEAIGLTFRRAGLPVSTPGERNVADFLYDLEWRHRARDVHGQPSPDVGSGRWLILADRGGVGGALASLLETRGQKCVRVFAAKVGDAPEAASLRISPNRPDEIRQLIETAGGADGELRGVVHLWSLDAAPPEQTTLESLCEDQALGCGTALHLVQALSQQSWRALPRLWIVTKGATAAAGESSQAVAQAPLWGFGRTLAHEQPALWGGLIDLDPQSSETDAAESLWNEVANHSDGEDQIAFRHGDRHVARFVRKRRPLNNSFSLRSEESASYLITGGLGDLGLEVARWLVGKGARHLLLVGRSELPTRSSWRAVEKGTRFADQVAAIQELESAGAKVYTASVDVADETQMTATLAACRAEGWPQIRGVVHAAAVIQGATLLTLDGPAMEAVMRPKMLGGWVLHRLFENEPLDFLVFFSAIPALLGWLGQGAANYAAANAFLDALAHHRRARGLPGQSINWGPWNRIGMAARAGDALERMAQQGVGSIAPAEGLHLLSQILSMDEPQCAVIAVDWHRFFHNWPAAAASKLLSELAEEQSHASPNASPPTARARRIREELLAADGAQRRRLLDAYVRQEVARVLKIAVAKLDVQQPLSNMGLDSLMAIELKNRVEMDLGIRVSMVTFLQGPSVAQLTTQVLMELEPKAQLSSAAQTQHGRTLGAIDEIDASERDKAQRLLATLDELTDDEVDSLLTALRAEE